VTFKKDIYNKFEKEEIIMMLNENIKAIRKQRGLSQEELAIRLHVVRQTVSKWEKGVSQTKGY
jgi:DNA-binding transcriptional regulator YiaG